MANKNIYHIGYHRTGTTFLQKKFFPKLRPYLKKDHIEIFSEEGYSGSLIKPDFDNVKKLKEEGAAKIIITIRSQLTIMPTLYWMYIKSGGHCSYKKFIELIIANEKLSYQKLLDAYFLEYGRENVLILFFEELKENTENYIRTISEFVGVDEKITIDNSSERVNTKATDLQILLYRLFNKIPLLKDCRALTYRCKILLDKLEKLAKCISPKLSYQYNYSQFSGLIAKAYKEDNAELAELLNISTSSLVSKKYPI